MQPAAGGGHGDGDAPQALREAHEREIRAMREAHEREVRALQYSGSLSEG